MLNRLTKETLDSALKASNIDTLPQVWDGVSKFSKAIVRVNSSVGELYAIAVPSNKSKSGYLVIETFANSAFDSNPLAIYPTSYVGAKKDIVEPTNPNTPILPRTPEEKEEALLKDRVMGLKIPTFEDSDKKREWLVEHKMPKGMMHTFSEKALDNMVIRCLYKEKYGEKLTLDLEKID